MNDQDINNQASSETEVIVDELLEKFIQLSAKAEKDNL